MIVRAKEPAKKRPAKPPLLMDGQRMDAEEFHRRYLQMPDVKAELVEGVVYMSSPVWNDHATPHAKIVTALGVYSTYTAGTEVADNASLRPNRGNENQPDALLYIHPECGGGIRLGKPLQGAPELVVEVSYTTKRLDREKKFKAYQDSGIREYLIWRVEDDEIDWFHAVNGVFQPLPRDTTGVGRSLAFTGLWLDIPALVAMDMPKVLATLNAGLASPEHAAFVEKLKAAKAAGEIPS